jgi:hypothetical protein
MQLLLKYSTPPHNTHTHLTMDDYDLQIVREEMERKEAAELALGNSAELALGNSAKLTLEESQRLLMTEEELEDIRRQWEEDNDEKAVSRRVRDKVFAASRHWLMEDELVPLPWVLPEYCRAMAPNLRTDGDWEPEPFYAMPVAKQPPIDHFAGVCGRRAGGGGDGDGTYGPYQPTEWDVDLPYEPEVPVA